MKKMSRSILTVLALSAQPLLMPHALGANPSINDMQSCQGLIGFLQDKVNATSAQHKPADTRIVQQGLKAYDRYIQQDIVAPGLLSFNKGNQVKADAMQAQVDAFKQSVIKRYQQRFPDNKLYMDFVISLNECAKKAVPKGQDLSALKASLNKLLELTRAQ